TPRRTKSYPASATICSLPGTTLGRRKAAQKKRITTSEPISASNITLLKYRLLSPSPQRGSKTNECSPGDGKPQPSKMWQSVSKASTCVGSALTAGSFGVTHGLGNLVVSARHEAADRHGTGVTAVGAAGAHRASRCGRRHLGCPRPRCRSWHRTIAGSRMRLYRGPTPHDGRPCASFFCSLTVESGST